MYLDALTELVPWFFALVIRTMPALPVHLRDMAELPKTTYREFNADLQCHFSTSTPLREAQLLLLVHGRHSFVKASNCS